MKITRYDQENKVVVKCDNMRQFKLIRRSLGVYLKFSKLITFEYSKYTKIIEIKADNEEHYNQIFDGIAIQMQQAARDGHLSLKVNIENG